MNKPNQKIIIVALASLLILPGCDQPKNKGAAEVKNGISISQAVSRNALNQKTPPASDNPNAAKPGEKTPNKDVTTDPNAKKSAADAPVNIYKDNATLKSVFESFDKANLQGSAFSGADMIKDLAEANLDTEKSKAVVANLFSVLENKDEALSKDLPPATRLRHIFDLCAAVPAFENALDGRLKELKINLPDGLTDQDKKTARAFLYATEVWHLFNANPTPDAGFNIYSSQNSDGNTYHIAILGRIEFAKGSKKTKLTAADKSNIAGLFDFWTAYLGSALAPKDTKFLVVGNGDRTGKSSANKTAGTKRANMVLKEMKSASYPDVFTVESWGDEMPLKDDPKDVANRRVELVLYKTDK